MLTTHVRGLQLSGEGCCYINLSSWKKTFFLILKQHEFNSLSSFLSGQLAPKWLGLECLCMWTSWIRLQQTVENYTLVKYIYISNYRFNLKGNLIDLTTNSYIDSCGFSFKLTWKTLKQPNKRNNYISGTR